MSMTIGNIIAEKAFSFGTDKTWSAVNTITVAEQTVNAPGVKVGDYALVIKPTHQAGLGYNAIARCAADGVLTVVFHNPTAGNVTPTAAESWSGLLFRAELPLTASATI